MKDHLNATLCLDAVYPSVGSVHRPDAGQPFLFVVVGGGLELWAHEPAALRRLAAACVLAADALDVAIAAQAVPV